MPTSPRRQLAEGRKPRQGFLNRLFKDFSDARGFTEKPGFPLELSAKYLNAIKRPSSILFQLVNGKCGPISDGR
jgi:hypothetical protein